jgi:hypothetical protein
MPKKKKAFGSALSDMPCMRSFLVTGETADSQIVYEWTK